MTSISLYRLDTYHEKMQGEWNFQESHLSRILGKLILFFLHFLEEIWFLPVSADIACFESVGLDMKTDT